MNNLIHIACVTILASTIQAENPCAERLMQYGIVCVCNSEYCDTVPDLKDLLPGQYQLYSTSQTQMGFHSITGNFSGNNASTPLTVEIPDLKATQQTIMGFGGAFTDTASYNILTLPEMAQNKLIESYFGKDGIQYTINRVTMGASDFSLRAYTNCDIQDDTLEHFALQSEDLNYKIPVLKKALEARGDELKLFLSSWSAPLWMKTEGNYFGLGAIKEEYKALWAQYYLKFFQAYRDRGVEFWGFTPQNEPYSGTYWNINTQFTFESMRDWLLNDIGPAIKNSTFDHLKFLLFDESTTFLPAFKNATFTANEDIFQYADGIATHWYTDYANEESWFHFPKDLFIIGSEACQDVSNYLNQNEVQLGDWERGVNYINSIIDDIDKFHYNGWVEWNLALNLDGGPSWMKASLDAPIIINADAGEFYKEPMFYTIGHFSKFVVPGSVKLAITTSDELTVSGIRTVAFLRPDGKVALILYNSLDEPAVIKVKIEGSVEHFTLQANSLNTLLYAP